MVYYNTSMVGLGYVLMQQGKVVAYTSKQLKVKKRNYPTRDQKLENVVFELKNWCHYLYGVNMDIYLDHKSLQYVLTKKELNLRQIR